ncbi:MAG: hypothetical protein JF601_00700, partial [Acidobacteria bacterium]|nr:hypothetical protein [Acidobacteriota bacterium]
MLVSRCAKLGGTEILRYRRRDTIRYDFGVTRHDHLYRRWATAAAVLRLVERERPEAVRRLQEWVLRVPAVEHGPPSNADTDKVITAWCRELNLACKAIEDEALTIATGGQPVGDASS